MKRIALIIVLLCIALSAKAQFHKTQNLIIITIDGFRWEEVFNGADSSLINSKKFVDQTNLQIINRKFWADTPKKRRKKLMPFLWSVIAKKGQIYGDRKFGNKVRVANPYWFSYPGYNEIFTGFPDKRINSNNYGEDPNTNVLGFINEQSGFQGKVVAFASWHEFNQIFNENRSGFLVNAGTERVRRNLNSQPLSYTQKTLNHLQNLLIDQRCDGLTFTIAFQYFKINHPRVISINLGNTDPYAHNGHYDLYLRDAHKIDLMIRKIWTYAQSILQYKNKTTLFITVDHGRGRGKEWTSHGRNIPYSNEIWFAVMGPDTPATGIVKTNELLYQKQFAQTLAHLLGLDFKANHPIGKRIKTVVTD